MQLAPAQIRTAALKAPAPAAAQAPTAPAQPSALETIKDSVAESADDWGHMGKKLGSFGAVAWGTSAVPLLLLDLAFRTNANIPMALVVPGAIVAQIGTMAAISLEEEHLGIGRHLGHAVGTAAGAAFGLVKGSVQALTGSEPSPETITLPKRQPSGKGPREALLPAALHAGQRAVFGEVPKRTRAVEMGECIGATAGTLILAYTLPRLVGNLVGGPIGAAMDTLVGPVTGMVIGGLEENLIGAGRAVGEAVGQLVSKATGNQESAPKPVKDPKPGEPGLLKKAFLEMNHVIGKPIIGYLVDTTVAANHLIFTEKAYQSTAFSERPSPQVNNDRLIQNFVHLAGIFGPSGQEEKIGTEVARQIEALGATWERRPDGTIMGTIAATPGQEDSPTVLLSAHLDTVHPTNPAAIRIGERKIHTDESAILGADDRAGIAEILEGIKVVQEQGLPHPEIKLVFPVDEERGLLGAARLKPEDISTRPTLGYVVDALDTRDLHLANDAVLVSPNSVKYNFNQEHPLIQVALRSMANAGTDPRVMHAPILTGAGSDANTPGFNSGLITSLAVGAGERDMHTPLENIRINDLIQAARHVVGYLTNACDYRVEGETIVPRQELNTAQG